MRQFGGTKRHEFVSRIRAGLIVLVFGILATATRAAENRPDIVIDGTQLFPESLSASANGDIFIGSVKGIVYKAEPDEAVARPWLHLTEPSGAIAILGVLTDEAQGTLWLCVTPNPFVSPRAQVPAAMVAVELATATVKARYPLPVPNASCNDAAVAADGTLYVTDTQNGRLFTLAPGAEALGLFGQDPQLNGIDGIAFSADGTLYVNTVSTGHLLRVAISADGKMGAVTLLETSRPLAGPDGFRPIAGNRFVLAEGNGGRVDEVTIDGDRAEIRVLAENLGSPPGVTLVGETVYAVDGKIAYLIDPKLKNDDPGPFTVHAIPLHSDKDAP